MNNKSIEFMNNNGELICGRILYAYEVKDNNICVVYTLDEKLEDGTTKTYAIIYDERNNKIKSIDDKNNYKIIEKLLSNFTKTKQE